MLPVAVSLPAVAVVAVVAVPAMAWEVLPTRRTIERTKQSLESGGVLSRLDEVLV